MVSRNGLTQLAEDYLQRERLALSALSLDTLSRIAGLLEDARARAAGIYVFGNGGSAATASHLAGDLNMGTRNAGDARFRIVCLNDAVPTMLAYANDVGYEAVFEEQLKNFVKPGDLVIGISASGNSTNILRAIELGNEEGAHTIGLTGFDGGRLARIARTALIVGGHDMQIVEDAHLVVTHILYKHFCELAARLAPKAVPGASAPNLRVRA